MTLKSIAFLQNLKAKYESGLLMRRDVFNVVDPYNLMLARRGERPTANAYGVLQSVPQRFSDFSIVNAFC
jgi:hypothetical protein